MIKLNLEEVKEASDNKRLTAGGYVAKITSVQDFPDKEYLSIEYDIAQGEFAGYFQNIFNTFGWWGGRLIRSYKETALSFFKSFIVAVENNNKAYKFDYKEQTLRGKSIGIVLGEEEYENNKGEIKLRLYVAKVCDIKSILDENFKVPDLKKLNLNPAQNYVQHNIDDNEIPF